MSGSLFIALADMFVLNLDAYRGSGTSFLNYSTRTMRLFIFCDVCLLLRRLLFTVESWADRLAVEQFRLTACKDFTEDAEEFLTSLLLPSVGKMLPLERTAPRGLSGSNISGTLKYYQKQLKDLLDKTRNAAYLFLPLLELALETLHLVGWFRSEEFDCELLIAVSDLRLLSKISSENCVSCAAFS